MSIARVLIIAGSDSGGGAGIQADIKTVTMLGGHAMTAVTAITAQNTIGVQAVHLVPTDIVVAQMRSCIDDIGVDAIKIGMIGSAQTAHAVADVLEELNASHPRHAGLDPASTSPHAIASRVETWTPAQACPELRRRGRGDGGSEARSVPIVFDPVMVATSGSILADADTIDAFDRLMRLAMVVTPNIPELEALGGRDAVLEHGCYLLEKGGHRLVPQDLADTMVDLLFPPTGGEPWKWTHPRINTVHTHGTGCTLASGLVCGLAEGLSMRDATARAITYVREALAAAPGFGNGHGPMGHALATIPYDKCRT